MHQNYPAQFGAFASFLGAMGWDVGFVTAAEDVRPLPHMTVYKMTPHREPAQGVHRFARGLEKAMINGQAFANTAIGIRDEGFTPDVVVAHSGWGSGTFAKAVWPDCKYVSYVEWYYRYPALDTVRDGAPSETADARAMALARNAPSLLDMAECDLLFCPTHFQAAQFPSEFRDKLVIMHDGIDTHLHRPNPNARPPLGDLNLPDDAEIITYATRGMEPHRGFPEFMRALALLQQQRPRLHAIIGGEDRVSYGPKLPEGDSWKTRMLQELDLDLDRIHWTGPLPRQDYIALLQSTHVHVYLTVPFVLSWSLIEAMAIGCPIVASKNKPVEEAIANGETGLLVDHKDIAALAESISTLLDNKLKRIDLGELARMSAIRRFGAEWIWPWRARVLEDLHRYG